MWRRFAASKGEMRTSRWTPLSPRKRPKAYSPRTATVALLSPASSPSSRSSSLTSKPLCSAHRRYIRRRISAQSWESVPPSPGWIASRALRSSSSPESLSSRSSAVDSRPTRSMKEPSSASSSAPGASSASSSSQASISSRSAFSRSRVFPPPFESAAAAQQRSALPRLVPEARLLHLVIECG